MNKEERLQILKLYFDTRRQAGHTYTMLQGAANMDSLIMVRSKVHAHHLQQMAMKKLATIAWDEFNIDELLNSIVPLIIDASALSEILGDALDLLRQERSKNYQLLDEIRVLRHRHDQEDKLNPRKEYVDVPRK